MVARINEAPRDATGQILCLGDIIAVAFSVGTTPMIRQGEIIGFNKFNGNKSWLALEVKWLAGFNLPISEQTQIQAEESRILIMKEACAKQKTTANQIN